jgi:hypothetical protein
MRHTWSLIIGHVVTGLLPCLTIIGIPLGLANFKLIAVTFRPFGRDIVSIEEAERQALSQQVTMPANARPQVPGGNGYPAPWPSRAARYRAKRNSRSECWLA